MFKKVYLKSFSALVFITLSACIYTDTPSSAYAEGKLEVLKRDEAYWDDMYETGVVNLTKQEAAQKAVEGSLWLRTGFQARIVGTGLRDNLERLHHLQSDSLMLLNDLENDDFESFYHLLAKDESRPSPYLTQVDNASIILKGLQKTLLENLDEQKKVIEAFPKKFLGSSRARVAAKVAQEHVQQAIAWLQRQGLLEGTFGGQIAPTQEAELEVQEGYSQALRHQEERLLRLQEAFIKNYKDVVKIIKSFRQYVSHTIGFFQKEQPVYELPFLAPTAPNLATVTQGEKFKRVLRELLEATAKEKEGFPVEEGIDEWTLIEEPEEKE